MGRMVVATPPSIPHPSSAAWISEKARSPALGMQEGLDSPLDSEMSRGYKQEQMKVHRAEEGVVNSAWGKGKGF